MTKQHPDNVPREFGSFLLEQARGKTHDELSQALHDVTKKVIETGKKGSLTLTLSIGLLGKDPSEGLVITDQIKTKIPEHDRPSSVFYPDKHGNLSRRDPNQLTFEDLQVLPEDPPGTNRVTGEIPINSEDPAQ